MPKAHYLEQMPSDVTIGLRNFVDWLLGTTRGITNGGAGTAAEGWNLIEADDGTIREIPGDGTFNGLDSGNVWKTGGSLVLSSWCVIEGDGTYGNKIQVLCRVEANTSRFVFQMIPLADWATGGGSTPTPSLPATIVPAGFQQPDNLTSNGWLIACANEGMFVLFYDNKSTNTQHMWYLGETDVSPADLLDDARPFVYWGDVNDPLDGDDFQRLSPVDDATVIGGANDGQLMAYCSYNVINMFTGNPRVSIGNRQEYTCGVSFNTVSHDHDAGRLRYLTLTHNDIGARGTMSSDGGSADDRFIINANNTDSAILMDWDGTQYP